MSAAGGRIGDLGGINKQADTVLATNCLHVFPFQLEEERRLEEEYDEKVRIERVKKEEDEREHAREERRRLREEMKEQRAKRAAERAVEAAMKDERGEEDGEDNEEMVVYSARLL